MDAVTLVGVLEQASEVGYIQEASEGEGRDQQGSESRVH